MPSILFENKPSAKPGAPTNTQYAYGSSSFQTWTYQSRTTPPAYYANDTKPPGYTASNYMRSLREGDPNEKVDVPMIHSTHKLSFGDYLPWGSAMKTGKRTVISRSMTRDCYVKHYAKDDEGNYTGTEKPYADWQLVFVPNKSTPENVLKQVFDRVKIATM